MLPTQMHRSTLYDGMLMEDSSEEEEEFLLIHKNLWHTVTENNFNTNNNIATAVAAAAAESVETHDAPWGGSSETRPRSKSTKRFHWS